MKSNLKFLLFFLVFINSYSQNKKLEAENFYKSIIKTYFDKDCDKLYNSINDSVTIIGSFDGKIYPSSAIKQSKKMCNRFEEYTSDLISYQKYIENYEIFVLNKEDFTLNAETIINKKSLERLAMFDVFENINKFNTIYSSNDYLIIGRLNKKYGSKDLHGPFTYVVRETSDGWKIYGTVK